MENLTHNRIYEEFCIWSPMHAEMVVRWKPWGSTSIVVWLRNGQAYKCKRHAVGKFTIQMVSEEDIERKLGSSNV